MRLIRLGFALLLLIAAAPAPLLAKTDEGGVPLAQQAETWKQEIEQVAGVLRSSESLTAEQAQALQVRLQAVQARIQEAEAAAQQRIAPLRDQSSALGPPPEEGEPPEADEIAAERQQIESEIAKLQTVLRQAELSRVRSSELLSQIGRRLQAQAAEELLTKAPSPLLPDTWLDAADNAGQLLVQLWRSAGDWLERARGVLASPRAFLVLTTALVFAVLLGGPARRVLLRRFGRDADQAEPSFARRTLAALVEGIARIMLPALAIAVVVSTLASLDLLSGYFGELLALAARLLTFFLVIAGLSTAGLAPHQPTWSILPIAHQRTRFVASTVTALAALFAVSVFLQRSATILPRFADYAPSLSLASVFFLIKCVTLGGLLLTLLPARNWTVRGDALLRGFWPFVRVLTGLVVIATPGMALAGYPLLADFVLTRVLLTGLAIGVAYLLRLVLREGLAQLLAEEGRFKRRVSRVLGLTDAGARMALFWTQLLLDVLIMLPLAYALLIFYGVPAATMNLWAGKLVSGIQIGEVSFAPIDIVLAMVVLIVGLSLASMLRRWLAERVLPNTALDFGVRNSIAAGVGYVGIGVAVMLAISALGLDFSNLALVAGALSVGIGFGLRAIVENFVSGLLLLVERPIKVGDWIVAGAFEGTVKHISVRATEIETFDRASVIVPNSELISGTVVNWTHKNRVARVVVRVGVAYGSDTRKVQSILLDCAKAQEHVLAYPEPTVLFRSFGDSALDFELRCFVPDTDHYINVSSELHFAIDEAFRAAGVEIPFPQRELHLRDGRALPQSAPAATAIRSEG